MGFSPLGLSQAEFRPPRPASGLVGAAVKSCITIKKEATAFFIFYAQEEV
jgi:hypothetical protein